MPAPEVEFNLCEFFLGTERLDVIGRDPAIEFNHRTLSYELLRRLVDYWAKRITAEGIERGDRVALLLFDSPEFTACFLASALIGAVCVPISTFLPPEDIEFVLSDSGSRLLIAEQDLLEKHSAKLDTSHLKVVSQEFEREPYDPLLGPVTGRAVSASTSHDTPCFILYTSGSTGRPKGVLHVHGSIPATVKNYSEAILHLRPSDRIFSSSRLFFAYGLGNGISFPLAAGATVILDPGRPTPDRIANLFADQRPSVFFGVPAIYNSLVEFIVKGGQLDTASLRLCVSAGEALPRRLFEEWHRLFNLPILDGIGSTEMLHIFLSNAEGASRAGSSGKAVRGYQVRLISDEGNEAITGEPGNLWVRGDSAFGGYWGKPELTREAVRDGWVRTGDLYTTDEDGFYYHVGRSDDCFKVRGLWVSPVEVESALLADKRVSEAAVVPALDEKGLATVRAFVVIRTEEAESEVTAQLLSGLRQRLPEYKLPSQIHFLDELPRTATGKVQRFKLRNPK